MMTIQVILVMFIGLAGGLAVGAGFVAFLAVLGIIPRLTQLSKTQSYLPIYEISIVAGALCGCWFSLIEPVFELHRFIVIPIGLASGAFIGLFAAALTEVLNVLPILAKRIGVQGQIVYLLMAIVLGKMFGSIFQWTIFIEGWK